MKKVFIIFILALALTSSLFVFAESDSELLASVVDFRVFVNGEEKEFDLPVIMIDNRTYIPLRETGEKLSMNVDWSKTNGAIYMDSNLPHDYYLFPFEHDNLWGYMDKSGNVVIEPKYYSADYFSDGLAIVSRENGEYSDSIYIDLRGELALTGAYYSASAFNSGYALVAVKDASQENRYHYVDIEGNNAFGKSFNSTSSFSEGFAVTQTQGHWLPTPPEQELPKKWSYLNTKGELATQQEYDEARSFKNGFAAVKSDGKWGIIDQNFNTVIDFSYDELGTYSEGLIAAKKGEKWGFINISDNVIVDFIYDEVHHYSEKYAGVKQDGRWGIIDTVGDIVIPVQFDNLLNFSEGLLSVKKDGKWGVINSSGKCVIAYNDCFFSECKNGLIMVSDSRFIFSHYVNTYGELIGPKIR